MLGPTACLCSLIFLLHLLMLCDGVIVDPEKHLCETHTPKWVPSKLSIKTRCPRNEDHRPCTPTEKKKLSNYDPRNQRCCAEKIKVNVIGCCDGWKFNPDDNMCVPECSRGCINGTCAAPDNCTCAKPLTLKDGNTCELTTCEDGYQLQYETLSCEPVCDNPCINGTCTAPNVCTCPDKYTLQGDTCVPVCTPACEMGLCTAPDTCDCQKGYKKSAQHWKCLPICETCENGKCVAPGQCECNDGYKKIDGICSPVCSQACTYGKCVEPDKCECDTNYKVDPKNGFNCFPICDNECVNASCVKPNTCACYPDYERVDNVTCKPKCTGGCQHGTCIGVNECSCDEGYQKENGTCKPKCDKNCTFGYCSEPNTCTCDKGYELDKVDRFKCQPKCDPECQNASCVSPNKCKCWRGFKIVDGRGCQPVCTKPCSHGTCVAPEECQCDEGFVKNETLPNICFKPCKLPCGTGRCNEVGVCDCPKAYQLENDTCSLKSSVDCSTCPHNCSEGDCFCEDDTPCTYAAVKTEAASALAGLELTWLLIGGVSLLLMTLLIVVMHKMWRKRKDFGAKATDDCNTYGNSVLYTMPDTLIRHSLDTNNLEQCDEEPDDEIPKKTDRLLSNNEEKEV